MPLPRASKRRPLRSSQDNRTTVWSGGLSCRLSFFGLTRVHRLLLRVSELASWPPLIIHPNRLLWSRVVSLGPNVLKFFTDFTDHIVEP
jgi:hypothetical protein